MLIVSTPDADSLRAALKAAGPAWERDIVNAHREVGKVAANRVRQQARAGTRRQRRAAQAVGQSASKKGAKVTVGNTAAAPFAKATFWGAKRRTGWYAADRYKGRGQPQFPRWVGNNWRAGVRGQGPYVVNDAIADAFPEILGVYGEQMDEVAKAIAARKVTRF